MLIFSDADIEMKTIGKQKGLNFLKLRPYILSVVVTIQISNHFLSDLRLIADLDL